jgi:hypothetical protein
VDDSKPPITTSFVDQYVARMSLLQTLASLSPRLATSLLLRIACR